MDFYIVAENGKGEILESIHNSNRVPMIGESIKLSTSKTRDVFKVTNVLTAFRQFGKTVLESIEVHIERG